MVFVILSDAIIDENFGALHDPNAMYMKISCNVPCKKKSQYVSTKVGECSPNAGLSMASSSTHLQKSKSSPARGGFSFPPALSTSVSDVVVSTADKCGVYKAGVSMSVRAYRASSSACEQGIQDVRKLEICRYLTRYIWNCVVT